MERKIPLFSANWLALKVFEKVASEMEASGKLSEITSRKQNPVDDREQSPDSKSVFIGRRIRLLDNPVSPQSTHHENYDAVDNEFENDSNPTSPSDQASDVLDRPSSPDSPENDATLSETQHSTQVLQDTFNSTCVTQMSLLGMSQADSTLNETANETFTNIPARPVIHPRVIPPEDQPKPVGKVNLLQHDDSQSIEDSFYDDFPGIEDMSSQKPSQKKPEDKYAQFAKYHEAEDPIAAFCKAKGINYTNCTPREYYKGFKKDNQFWPKEKERKAAKDLSEYKKGDSIWNKRKINGWIYMQLKSPGYCCNPQEFIEFQQFTDEIGDRLFKLGLMKNEEIIDETIDEEKEAQKEAIVKGIRKQFEFQKRNMNDRWDNLEKLEKWKNQIAERYGIDFDDDDQTQIDDDQTQI